MTDESDLIEQWQLSTGLLDASGDAGTITPEDNERHIKVLQFCADCLSEIVSNSLTLKIPGVPRHTVLVNRDIYEAAVVALQKLPKEAE
jgi:hypothetical protein